MNTTILAADLTADQKEQISLISGTTWADVESVTLQLRKDGSIANYKIAYMPEDATEKTESVKFFNGLKAIQKFGVSQEAVDYKAELDNEVEQIDRIEKALAVLASEHTGYQIWKETGVTESQLSRYRSDKLKAQNMTIANAIKLSKFYDKFLK